MTANGCFDTQSILSCVPAPAGAAGISFHDCTDGVYMAFIPNIDAPAFAQYTTALQAAGYVEIARTEQNGNCFCTFEYRDRRMGIHVYRIHHSSELRVVAKQNMTLPPLRAESTAEICRELIVQLNAGHDVLQMGEGMSYVLRLADGRFIVIDGGYRRGFSALMLYDTLREYAPDPENIVVAGWYFSHAHPDHAGGFIEFAEMYGRRPEFAVESFLYNFCDDPQFCAFLPADLTAAVRETVAGFYPNAKIYHLQTGQRYFFGATELQVLYTPQDFMPRCIPNEADVTPTMPRRGDGNQLSVVVRVVFSCGKSFFVMGDVTTDGCDELCRRYGGAMKSDYVQMAHHGISRPSPRAQNATPEIYDEIAAGVALLPCSVERSEARMQYDVNAHLAATGCEIIVAGKGRCALPVAEAVSAEVDKTHNLQQTQQN